MTVDGARLRQNMSFTDQKSCWWPGDSLRALLAPNTHLFYGINSRLCVAALPNRAPAGSSATGARKCTHVLPEIVVHRQLLSGLDGAQAHIQHMPFHDAAHQVGIAAMVDDLGAAAAYRAVQGPVIVHRKEVGVIAVAAVFGLFPVQALAGVLNHLTISRNPLAGEDSIAMNLRAPDQELETDMFFTELRPLNEIGSHADHSF